jgi:hypothetical protein
VIIGRDSRQEKKMEGIAVSENSLFDRVNADMRETTVRLPRL